MEVFDSLSLTFPYTRMQHIHAQVRHIGIENLHGLLDVRSARVVIRPTTPLTLYRIGRYEFEKKHKRQKSKYQSIKQPEGRGFICDSLGK